jgi:predicted DNA-binding transcriptional regulator AlpA
VSEVLLPRQPVPETGVTPAAVPFAMDARGLAAMLSGSVRWIRTQDAAGKLPRPIRVAGRVLWLREEIESWLKAGAPDRATWEVLKAARKT